MARLTPDEARAFLSAAARTAKLATVRADGSPHVVPVWFALDGETLVFTTGAGSVKGRALRRDPRVSLCVEDDRPPYASVRVDGTASLSEDLDDMLRWAKRIGARYMGEPRAEEFGRRNAVPGELLVRVAPTKVVGVTELAG